jgi:hypothetical protein
MGESLNNDELQNTYISPNLMQCKDQEDEIDKAFSLHGKKKESTKDFGKKTRRKSIIKKIKT